MSRQKYIIVSALVFIVAIFSSCFTVKYDFKGVTIDPEIKTCSVQYFQNRAQRVEPMLAQLITNMLKDKIRAQTRLSLVNEDGDVNFDGTIVEFKESFSGVKSGDQASQNRFTIAVKVKFSNSIDPEADYEKTFSRYVDYPSSETFETAISSYTEDILDLLTEDIFNEAFVNW
jgi:hypothetical protein